MHGYDVEGGYRSGGGQRGMEGLCHLMCRLAHEGLKAIYYMPVKLQFSKDTFVGLKFR